jgi:Na+/H+-translocating membrane pyrophosphatase
VREREEAGGRGLKMSELMKEVKKEVKEVQSRAGNCTAAQSMSQASAHCFIALIVLFQNYFFTPLHAP